MIRLTMVVCVACVLVFSGCKLSLEFSTEFQQRTVNSINENTLFFQETTTNLCFMSSYIGDSYMVSNVPCDAAMKSPKFVKVEQK